MAADDASDGGGEDTVVDIAASGDGVEDYSRGPYSENEVAVSLCGMLGEPWDKAKVEAFEQHRLTIEQLQENPSIVTTDACVFCVRGKLLPWKAAMPVLTALAVFNYELKPDLVDPTSSKKKKIGWKEWIFGGHQAPSTSTQPKEAKEPQESKDQPHSSPTVEASEPKPPSPTPPPPLVTDKPVFHYRSLAPTAEQLATLNLKWGKNKIKFTVSKVELVACMYYMHWNSKIVISDVDGTITKSDVLGQVLPTMGRDWSHHGVTGLYRDIHNNGYHLLYLTARAIGQAGITRSYLHSLKQQGVELPPGPVIMSPDRLFPSFHREVIRRAPQEFKITCLDNIRKLFPEDFNPFYAGFGNRPTDAQSYIAVGMPAQRCFTIDPKGSVDYGNQRSDTYVGINDRVDDFFPSVVGKEHIPEPQYNDFNYWKV